MTRYLVQRLLGVVPTVLLLLLLVVVMVRIIPGNIVDIMLTEQGGARNVDREAFERRLGIDEPLPVQYARYTAGVLRGDLGRSLWDQRPVSEMIFRRLPTTLELAFLAMSVSIVIAITFGVLAAIRQDTLLDYVPRSFAVLGLSIPDFALGTMVLVLPTLWFSTTVPLIWHPFSEDPVAHLLQVMIPAVVVGVRFSASVMRLTRTMMLEVLRQDYTRTAWAKGLSERAVVIRHGLKNALIPVVTLLGLELAALISGIVIMESIFAIPGVGRLLIESISARDYPVIQGITVVIGTLVILVNLAVDLSYGFLDPRVRLGGRGG
jgi:peptide/nickel transport system permease protein